jgi:hypothetical protein
MKVLSFDVGIANLAYCVLEKIEEDFKILKWGVINLVDDRQKCDYQMVDKKCDINAKFVIYDKDKSKDVLDENIYSCSRHKIKLMPMLEEIVQKKKIVKYTCDYCSVDATHICKKLDINFCEEHLTKWKKIIKFIGCKKYVTVSCGRQPQQTLSEKLFTRLDLLKEYFLNVDEVLIENQPSMRNPVMKTISVFLYSYFVIRGTIDNKLISYVKFISPSNKLKIDVENTNEILGGGKTKEKVYKLTKELGIWYCRSLISDDDDKIIELVKKKDDMADAFLQAFQYLFRPIPKKYLEKIYEIDNDTKIVKKKKGKKDVDDHDEENNIIVPKKNKNKKKNNKKNKKDDDDNSE